MTSKPRKRVSFLGTLEVAVYSKIANSPIIKLEPVDSDKLKDESPAFSPSKFDELVQSGDDSPDASSEEDSLKSGSDEDYKPPAAKRRPIYRRSSKKLMNEVKVAKEESPEKGEGSTPKRRYRRRSSKGSAEKGEGSTPKRRYRRRSSVASKERDEDHPKKKRGRLSAEREKNREESSDTDSEIEVLEIFNIVPEDLDAEEMEEPVRLEDFFGIKRFDWKEPRTTVDYVDFKVHKVVKYETKLDKQCVLLKKARVRSIQSYNPRAFRDADVGVKDTFKHFACAKQQRAVYASESRSFPLAEWTDGSVERLCGFSKMLKPSFLTWTQPFQGLVHERARSLDGNIEKLTDYINHVSNHPPLKPKRNEVLKETVAHLVARMKKANGMEVDVPPLTKSYSEYLSKYEMKKNNNDTKDVSSDDEEDDCVVVGPGPSHADDNWEEGQRRQDDLAMFSGQFYYEDYFMDMV